MYFGLGETITRTMTENFREMKVACNSIFKRIFKMRVITDSWGMFP